MTILKKVKSHPEVVDFFKNFPFTISTFKKQKLNTEKTLICFLNFLFMSNCTFKKNPIKQSEASKSSIKDLFGDMQYKLQI